MRDFTHFLRRRLCEPVEVEPFMNMSRQTRHCETHTYIPYDFTHLVQMFSHQLILLPTASCLGFPDYTRQMSGPSWLAPAPRGSEEDDSSRDSAIPSLARRKKRKPHQKSRSGCKTCKKRKIKVGTPIVPIESHTDGIDR